MKYPLFMKRGLLVVGLMFIVVSSTMTVSAGRSRTWYVDDSNTGGPWDGSLEHPYQHINDATGVAVDGDTIYVFNGTYIEQVNISTSIHLLGEDKTTTILRVPLPSPAIGILCNATNLTISGFTIHGDSNQYFISAIWIADTWPYHSNHNIITDNVFSNDCYGLYFINSNDNMITDNTFIDCQYSILQEWRCGNTYSHNVFINGSFESFEENYSTIIHHNTFQNTSISLTGGPYEVYANTFSTSAVSYGYSSVPLIFQNNRFFASLGLNLIWPLAWNDLTIQNNTIDDRPLVYWYGQTHSTVPTDSSEVILADCTDITIDHLNLTGTYGIMLASTTQTKITNNTLADTTGIQLYNSTDNLIAHNTIDGGEPAITLTQSSKNHITANTLTDSGIQSIFSSNNTYTANTIQEALTGILINLGDDNHIESNQIQADLTLSLSQTQRNTITNNNFLHAHLGHVILHANSLQTSHNTWRHNYWSGHIPLLPKLILGLYPSGFYRDSPFGEIPIYFLCLNIDPRPALLPNPIP